MAEIFSIVSCVAPLTATPASDDALLTELLHGEQVEILEKEADWSRIRSITDSYTGWTETANLGKLHELTHQVSALGSFLYRAPNLKSPVLGRLSFHSRIAAEDREGEYLRTTQGWLHAATLSQLAEKSRDPVEIARSFLGIPYKWGGRTTCGMDCSALVQLAYAACGIALPRDSGPQRDFLSQEKPLEQLTAGDLVFMPGHVMLATGPNTLIHANAFYMRVTEEPLAVILARLQPCSSTQKVLVKACPILA